MNVLFVDNVCHLKTRSADFLLEILSRHHQVKTHYYERCYHCDLPQEMIDWSDIVVFWEFLPYRFACGVTGKRCVFVPMYDNEWGSRWLWRRLAWLKMNVVSFCHTVANHARQCGVENVIEVQYAKNPADFRNMAGDPSVALFWNRNSISPDAVRQMFAEDTITKLIIQDRFLPREEYDAMIKEVGVYIAPRFSEGIGMSFLEPLAMGKCVIAHDAPTMNEYIVNGENGILVDMRNPHKVSAEEIVQARIGTIASAQRFYDRWLNDQNKLLDFVDNLKNASPLQSPWSFRSIVAYGLYWLEGAGYRIKEKCYCLLKFGMPYNLQ